MTGPNSGRRLRALSEASLLVAQYPFLQYPVPVAHDIQHGVVKFIQEQTRASEIHCQ
jgi:hypothetical protein